MNSTNDVAGAPSGASAAGATARGRKPTSSDRKRALGLNQVGAGLVCGTLIAFGVGLVVTLFVPGHDGLDEAFLGGLVLAAAWPVATLWVLFAPDGRGAWLRGLLAALALLGAAGAGLML
ncbi:MAG: hypothetical protein AAGF23_11495 [Acidobacteriota bacterium]